MAHLLRPIFPYGYSRPVYEDHQLTGVTIWYHPRDGIPGSLTAGAQSIDTSTLGNPVASYSSSTCDINKFFTSQQMTLDITLCGDYAGSPAILGATCPALQGDKTCYSKLGSRFARVTHSNNLDHLFA